MPYSDHIHEWDRRREAADTRPTAPVTRAPAGMLGAWSGPVGEFERYRNQMLRFATPKLDWKECPDCGREPCQNCRLDRELARIHRGQQ